MEIIGISRIIMVNLTLTIPRSSRISLLTFRTTISVETGQNNNIISTADHLSAISVCMRYACNMYSSLDRMSLTLCLCGKALYSDGPFARPFSIIFLATMDLVSGESILTW